MKQEKNWAFLETYFKLESRNSVLASMPAQAVSLQQPAEFKHPILFYLLKNTVGTEEIENGSEEKP